MIRVSLPGPKPSLWAEKGANNLCSSAVNNATIATYMKDWIISFVTDLDPNANTYGNATNKPYWPQYNPTLGSSSSAPEFAIMDVNYTQIGVIPDLDVNPRCDFFHASSYDVRN